MGKKAKKYLFLCLVCLLIALPNSALANSSTNDDVTALQEQSGEIENSVLPAEESSPAGDAEDITGAVPDDDNSTVATEAADDPVTDPAAGENEPETENNPQTNVISESSSDLDQNAVEGETIPETNTSTKELQTSEDTSIETLPDPEILDVQFEPYNAKIGDKVTVTVNIKDESSVINGVYAYLYPNTVDDDEWALFDSESVRLRYDSANKQWIGFFIVQETWQPGSWEAYVYAEGGDPEDPFNYYEDEYYNELAFNVQNEGDYLSPTIGDVSVTPTPVIAGQEVKFEATIEDLNPSDKSKAVYALLTIDYYETPEIAQLEMLSYYENDFERFIPLILDSDSNKWIGTTTIPANIPDGTVIYYSILASDMTGNLSENDEDYFFTVSNPDEVKYTTPPELRSFKISGDSDSFVAGDKVEVIADVIDNIPDGVKSVFVDLNFGTKEIELKYDENDQLWKGTIDLSYLKEGIYNIYLYAEDINGNGEYFNTEKSINVSNVNSDSDDPIIGMLKVEPGTDLIVKVGDELKISVPVDDGELGSGVKSVMAYIDYPTINRSDEVELTRNEDNGLWEGLYKLEEKDPEHYFWIEIDAEDNAGNWGDNEFVILIDNTLNDVLPPYIDFVKYPPATVSLGEIAHFETQLVDEQSGINSAKVTFYNIEDLYFFDFDFYDQNSISVDLTNTSGNVWEADYIIPPGTPTGLYLVSVTVL